MIIPPALMRFLLIACLVGLAVIAVFYLRGRQLTYWGYIGWGLVAILIPLAGPFIVLLAQPGKKRQVTGIKTPLNPQGQPEPERGGAENSSPE